MRQLRQCARVIAQRLCPLIAQRKCPLGVGGLPPGHPEFTRHGGKLWLSFEWWAGELELPCRTDNRRHPIRVSLGGSLSSVARFRFAGRFLEYTMPLLTAIPLTLLALCKEPCSLPGLRLRVGQPWLPNWLWRWRQRYGVRDEDRSIGDPVPVIIHVDIPFGHDMDDDPLVYQAGIFGSRQQLQQLPRPTDTVVCPNLASLSDGEVVIEVQLWGERHPGGIGILRDLGEAQVVPANEAWQEGVGLFQRGDAGYSKLFGQTVLQGAPEALDAPLRLWGIGR